MARTFLSQPEQIFSTETFRDDLTTGTPMLTSANLESDLNNIRTQVRQVLWAGVSGSWYNPISTSVSGTLSTSGEHGVQEARVARGINTINTDLTAVEQHRFMFRRQVQNLVIINSSSNYAELSVSIGNAPISPAAATGFATGSVVAGTPFGVHSMALISGSALTLPKNLVIVKDAYTNDTLSDIDGKEIFGLLQAETAVVNGDIFNDTTGRTQISFVKAFTSSSLAPASISAVGGKHIVYQHPFRSALESIPDDAYLTDTIFVDVISGSAALSDITLQRAIDNQVGTVDMEKNVSIDIGAEFAWSYLSGTQEMWKLLSSDTENQLQINVGTFAVTASNASFTSGLTVDASGNPVQIGINTGTVQTLSGTALILSGGASLQFSDLYAPTSNFANPLSLSTGSAEWDLFENLFGPEISLIGAFNELSSSLNNVTPSGSLTRERATAGTTQAPFIPADTNVTSPTNLDAALLDYSDVDFTRDINVYLGGVLLLPGTSVSESNDVYPGDTASSGDLKFPYKVRSGSQITMEKFKGSLPVS